MESSGVDGSSAAISGPLGPGTAPFRPENGLRATSQIWAAVLCFVAAIGATLSAVLGVVAAALVSASIAAVGEQLPDDTKSTISELGSLNWAAAGAGVLIAAAFVVGGVAVLRRKPAGRAIVTATCALNVLAAVAVFLIGRHIWAGIDDAMGDVTSVEVTNLDPGLAGVIAKCLLAAVILVLVFWTSIRPSRVQAHPAMMAPAAGAGPSVAVPASKGSAVTSAVLSLVGGSLCAIGAIACLIGALNSGLPEHERIISVIVGAPASAFTAALISGGVLLLRRHVAAALVLATTWTLIILLAGGLLFAVARNPNRPTGALGWVILGVFVVIGYAATAATLALAPSTQRWCRTKITAHQAIPASAPESTTVAPTFQAPYGGLTYQGADDTNRRGRTPRRRVRWMVLVCAVVVAVVAGGVAVVHWWPRSSPGGPSNTQEPPVGTPKDRLIGFALDRRPVPAWQVSVTDLGFTPETRVGDLFAAVSDRAYFSTLRSNPDKTVTGLVYGLDTKTGKPLFPPIEMPGWSGVTCSTNGPSTAICVTDSCPESIISCTGQHEQLWVIDLDEGKVTYTGDPKVQAAGSLESRSHPGRPVLVPIGPSHGASWLVASAEGKGVYGVGSQGEPTWFLPGSGDLTRVEINDPRVDDITPLTVGIQKSSSGNDDDLRVFSVDGRDLTPTPPQGQRMREVRVYVGGFAGEFDGGPSPRGVGLYDSDGKQVAMLTGAYEAMANPAMPIIAQNRPDKNYDTGGLQVYTAAGKPQVNVPASILDHFRIIGTKLYAGQPPGTWRSWDLFTGQQGPACDMQLDNGEYVGSDGTTIIWRDISNQEFIAVDPATCQTLWKVPVKTGDDSFEVMQKAGTSLLRLTEHTIAGLRPPA